MNNIDRIREYIKDAVISPLERLMNGDSGEPEVNLYEKYYLQGGYPPKDSVYRSMLHAMMVPYYEMYLNGDTRLCCAGNRLEFVGRKMESIIEDDDQFGNWASDKDLINAAENWGDNLKRFEKESRRIYRFFHVLEVLLESDCQQDWRDLSQKLKEMLFKSELCYDYKTDEVLCVLHAFTMIMQQNWPKEKKKEMLNLLNQHWLFLKHYYSVMIRHIIREMDKVMLLMQEEMNRVNEHSELLYPLCDAIFPEDFQRLLREHRPKSYKEIENESNQKDELILQLKDQTNRTRKELEKSKEIIEKMVLSSIPIEDVDAELEQYPPGTAWDMLKDLNANPIISMQKAWRENPIISMQKAWREHYPELLRKYRARLFGPIEQQQELAEAITKVAERPTYGAYYASGSTHDDKSSKLVLGEEKEKMVPLKRISNE